MNIRVRQADLEGLHREADGFVEATVEGRPPRIGISANRKDGLSCIGEAYVTAVVAAGGAPVMIPVTTDMAALAAAVAELDGLLLSGGGDINPLYLKDEPAADLTLEDVDAYRDEYDFLLLRLAFNYQLPIMGICRGHQLLNVAFGGSLYQDIPSQVAQALRHSQPSARELPSHSVRLTKGSRLADILQTDSIAVNSFHHQAVKNLAPGFVPTAVAPDGINEGMEHPEYDIFSVQWHPECMAANGDAQALALFRHHIAAAARFARAKAIHRNALTIDSHTDTPMIYDGAFDFGQTVCGVFREPYTEGKVSLPLMERGRLDAVFMAAYIPQGERTDKAATDAWLYACERLEQVTRQASLHPDRIGIARTTADLRQLKREGKKAIVPALENAYPLGKKHIQRLAELKQMGVAYITLCHNANNDICDAATDSPEWHGLSPFGRKVIRTMNKLGIIIDISHASEDSFRQVLKKSRLPIIASHSAARAICDHPRNLSDEQIKALAKKGGVIQLCLYGPFLRNNNPDNATLADAIRHIRHIVELVGIEHIGIGSDFDGGASLIGCRAANELIRLSDRLLQEGFNEQDLRKLWGDNLLRVMDTVQAAALPSPA